MKSDWLAPLIATAIIGLQAWTLHEVVTLKAEVAVLKDKTNRYQPKEQP
jgi:hypothetical protein